MAAALSSLLVADFSRVLAGPYATMLLADLGAEVVKVERPGGDDTRRWGPPFDGEGRATYFESVNRNKKSRVLDLADTVGRSAALELAAAADVVVENFAPGGMARFGLGYEDIRERNPRVVYCSITGFGAGPGAEMPGYDLLVQAVGGLMSITGPDADHPTKTGVAVVDVMAGLHAAVGILAALRERDRSGQGQLVEVSLLGSLLSGLVNQSAAYLGAGEVPRAMGNAHPSIAPYETYPTADRPIVVAVGNDAQFRRLCRLLGLPGLAGDPRFATNPQRVRHRHALNAELAAVLLRRPAQHWLTRCADARVPAGRINSIDEAFTLARDLGLDPVVEIEGPGRCTPSRQVAHPVRLSRTPAEYRSAPPDLP